MDMLGSMVCFRGYGIGHSLGPIMKKLRGFEAWVGRRGLVYSAKGQICANTKPAVL